MRQWSKPRRSPVGCSPPATKASPCFLQPTPFLLPPSNLRTHPAALPNVSSMLSPETARSAVCSPPWLHPLFSPCPVTHIVPLRCSASTASLASPPAARRIASAFSFLICILFPFRLLKKRRKSNSATFLLKTHQVAIYFLRV